MNSNKGFISFSFLGKPMYLVATEDDNIVFSPKGDAFENAEMIQKYLFPFCEVSYPDEETTTTEDTPYYIIFNKSNEYLDNSKKFSARKFQKIYSLKEAQNIAKKLNAYVEPINHDLVVDWNGIPQFSIGHLYGAHKGAINILLKKSVYDQRKVTISWINSKTKEVVHLEEPNPEIVNIKGIQKVSKIESNDSLSKELLKDASRKIPGLESDRDLVMKLLQDMPIGAGMGAGMGASIGAGMGVGMGAIAGADKNIPILGVDAPWSKLKTLGEITGIM